jgi:hypothetical protein
VSSLFVKEEEFEVLLEEQGEEEKREDEETSSLSLETSSMVSETSRFNKPNPKTPNPEKC